MIIKQNDGNYTNLHKKESSQRLDTIPYLRQSADPLPGPLPISELDSNQDPLNDTQKFTSNNEGTQNPYMNDEKIPIMPTEKSPAPIVLNNEK